MKIGLPLDAREAEDRREIFQRKVSNGDWYACIASVDLVWFIPIVKTQKRGGSIRYFTSLPTLYSDLGIKKRAKSFSRPHVLKRRK
jgi:hypothetical protein